MKDIADYIKEISIQLNSLSERLKRIETNQNDIKKLIGPFGTLIDHETVLVQTIHGIKYLIPSSDLVMTPQLIIYRQWEANLSRLLIKLCQPGTIFVDVGANFGYFTCLIASNMGKTQGSKVIAIEPNPYLITLLEKNIRINWSQAPIEVVAMGCGSSKSVATLVVQNGNFSNGSISTGNNLKNTDAAVEVKIDTLDNILLNEPRIDVIKIDVEGYEPAVFAGAQQILANNSIKFIIEWSRSQLLSCGFDPFDFPSMLLKNGYYLYDAEFYLDKGSNCRILMDDLLSLSYINLLALKEDVIVKQ
jgi:FkbM family methyltransferase